MSEDPVLEVVNEAYRECKKKLRVFQESAQRRLERERQLQADLNDKMTEIQALRSNLEAKEEELRNERKRAREEQEKLHELVQKRVAKVVEAAIALQRTM